MYNCNNCNKTIDNKKDKIIPCFHCYKIFCEECYIKYLTTKYKYNCIHCKASFGKNFICKYLSKEFIDKLEKDFIENHKLENSLIKEINNSNCFNCKDGTLYVYAEQIICNKCKSIFCISNFEQIYPEKIITIDFEYLELIYINNPLFSSYTEEQKLKTKNHYKKCIFCNQLNKYKYECPYCRSKYDYDYYPNFCIVCSHLMPLYSTPNPIYKQFIEEYEKEKEKEFIKKYNLEK